MILLRFWLNVRTLTFIYLVLINIYGRNVINTDGDAWRLHRRVTGQAFSERLHRSVWQESVNQAQFMMQSWITNNCNADQLRVPALERDALHLALHVITGAAYGYPLKWDEDPPCASPTDLTFRAAVVQFTAHLMPIFLTPRWLLRLGRKDSTRGRAWEAYTAFESYMHGMLDRQRARLCGADCTDENLLTVLIQSENQEGEKANKKMSAQEVMGNTFIFLFAGHETTANTLHYSLLLLAQRLDVQRRLLEEVDGIYEKAAQEGRYELEYELDFNRARWPFAIMVCGKRHYTHCVPDVDSTAVRNTANVYPDWNNEQMDCDRPTHHFRRMHICDPAGNTDIDQWRGCASQSKGLGRQCDRVGAFSLDYRGQERQCFYADETA
jgi:hypothetical protein